MTTKPTELDTQELRDWFDEELLLDRVTHDQTCGVTITRDFGNCDCDKNELFAKILALIAQREQEAELRGREQVSEYIWQEYGRRYDISALEQATKPLDNSERNAHYNVYKLGKEYREATKPEIGTV